MCRFIAYMGTPVTTDELLFKPDNSLIKQSIHAKESTEPLNGDGFGLGWYSHYLDHKPAVFRSIQPAWNDSNLKQLAPKILSSCFFAHVRHANSGGVAETNCHPFHRDQWLFMHNGYIDGFTQIKRQLRRLVSDEIYDWLEGQTDSEHFFALILEYLRQKGPSEAPPTVRMMKAIRHAIDQVQALRTPFKLTERPLFLNVVLSDGYRLVATRYVLGADTPRSLHYAIGPRVWQQQSDAEKATAAAGAGDEKAILIASERLNSHETVWQTVPENHFLVVEADLSIALHAMD